VTMYITALISGEQNTAHVVRTKKSVLYCL
jgi:hypothetical protein